MGIAKFSKSNRVLTEYLSDVAVAVIGEGWKLEHNYSRQDFSNLFEKINNASSNLDDLFIKPLKSLLLSGNKHMVLVQHFAFFKQANLNPIFGTLIEDNSIRNLVLGRVRVKLCEYMSLSESLWWRKYQEGILDYLGPCLEKSRDNIEDYENDIASAFANSACKLNSETLTMKDCLCFREKTFSKPLMKILAEHFKMIQISYLQIVH